MKYQGQATTKCFKIEELATITRIYFIRFSKEYRKSTFKGNENPGPGSYTHKSTLAQNGPHLHQKLDTKIEDRPGPGEYDIGKYDLANSPKAILRLTQSRDSKKWMKTTTNPGPGEYQHKSTLEGKKYGYIIT
jgi:hypothetical protein